jgi:hypothetical protein
MQATIYKCTFKCNMQVHELAPPTCVLQILIDPLDCQITPYLCNLSSFICEFLSPFVTKYYKRWAPILDRLGWKWGLFSQIWFNLNDLPKKFNSVWSKDKLLHTTFIGYLAHVELNSFSSLARSNTRFTSPQTCHMLPLDQVNHISNSSTIQASNSFDFHEWA